jgi:TonB family protein
MKSASDLGWREIGVSVGLHGSALAVIVALAAAVGSGSAIPGASGEREGLLGVRGLRVFPVALLAGTPEEAAAGARQADPVLPADAAATKTSTTATPATAAAVSGEVTALKPPSESSPAPSDESTEPLAGTEAAATEPPVEPSQGDREAGGAPGSEVIAAREGGRQADADGRDAEGPSGGGLVSGSGGTSGGGGVTGTGGSDRIAPSPLHIAVPPLPRGVDGRKARGATVRMLLYVSETGDVREVKLLTGSGILSLDEAALGAARSMRYSPGYAAGAPAAMWTEAEISF